MNWDDLRYVLETARCHSLSRASERLKVNHSTVLRRIRAFEEEIGSELFDRDKRGYRLNAHGMDVIKAIEQLEQAVLSLERRLRGRSAEQAGTLRLSASEVVFSGLIAGKLQQFTSYYPDITVEVVQNYRSVSLSRREADVVIRATQSPPEHLVGRRLSGFAWAVYESADNPHARNQKRPWIALDDSLSHMAQAKWQCENIAAEDVGFIVNSVLGVVGAVKAGAGKAPLPCLLGDADSGLRRVGGLIGDLYTDLWMLTHEELKANAAIQAFSAFMFDAIKRDRDLLEGRRAAHSRSQESAMRIVV